MGKRVANVAHLDEVLALSTPRAAPHLPQPVVSALGAARGLPVVTLLS